MKTEPLVSILMTAYNRQQFIAEAIESVLTSTYQNWELIIVDDASQDSTYVIAKSYSHLDTRIRVVANSKNVGDYANRNKAAQFAVGKYLKFLDSDDLIFPNALAIMVESMEKYPAIPLGICCDLNMMSYPVAFSPKESYRLYYFGNKLLSVGPSATILRRTAFELETGFKTEQFIGDTELWLRIARTHGVLALQPNLFFWRIHPEQQMQIEKRHSAPEAIRFELDKSFLRHSHCPLDANESSRVIRNLTNIKCRNIIELILKGKCQYALYKKQRLRLSLRDFALSFLPNYKFK